MKNKIISLIFLLLAAIVIVGTYVVFTSRTPDTITVTIDTPTQPNITAEDLCAKYASSTDVYSTGYQLFKPSYYDTSGDPQNPICNPWATEIKYVNAGDVESGTYKGYRKVLAFLSQNGDLGGSFPTYFITKDYITFEIVDNGTSTIVTNYMSEGSFNQKKVIGTVSGIDFAHTAKIQIGDFTYNFMHYDISPQPLGKKLGSIGDLDIYEGGFNPENIGSFGYKYYQAKGNDGKGEFDGLKNYYQGRTNIHVKDKNGVVAEYSLNLSTEMNDVVVGITGKTIKKPYNNIFSANDFISDIGNYGNYSSVTPTPCGQGQNSYVIKNVSMDELKQVGHIGGVKKHGPDLYVLKNVNHLIMRAEYAEKVSQYTPDEFLSLNSSIDATRVPTFSEYITGYPVLFFKDAWNRLVAVGENDYVIDGGCGKPVIYLYPKTDTSVHLEVQNVNNFSHQIPSYKGGWDVLAHPSGILSSQNREDCEDYINADVGSEYAYEACKNNQYPYIYWSGNVSSDYTIVKDGFVVSKNELKNSLDEKLSLMGFTDTERGDFIEFWYPEMLKTGAPFYRISFFNTQEVNRLFPMKVVPTPDSVLRTFLDWEPLAAKISINPQTVEKTDRHGFSYVEWGGLKR